MLFLPLPMQAMVNFIYADELPSIHELAGSVSMSTSTVVVQHLLAAADRYGLDRLRILCEAKLCDELTPETVATTLALAEQHHCAELKSSCLKFAAVRENLGGMTFSLEYETYCIFMILFVVHSIVYSVYQVLCIWRVIFLAVSNNISNHPKQSKAWYIVRYTGVAIVLFRFCLTIYIPTLRCSYWVICVIDVPLWLR